MRHFVEAVEGIFPLDNLRMITRRNGGDGFYWLIFQLDEESQPLQIVFNSERGRDAGYAEIVNGLGRVTMMNVARYQSWEDRR